jgi:hypothetical protein
MPQNQQQQHPETTNTTMMFDTKTTKLTTRPVASTPWQVRPLSSTIQPIITTTAQQQHQQHQRDLIATSKARMNLIATGLAVVTSDSTSPLLSLPSSLPSLSSSSSQPLPFPPPLMVMGGDVGSSSGDAMIKGRSRVHILEHDVDTKPDRDEYGISRSVMPSPSSCLEQDHVEQHRQKKHVGFDLDSTDEQPPRQKRRRFQRRNSKTAAMLLHAIVAATAVTTEPPPSFNNICDGNIYSTTSERTTATTTTTTTSTADEPRKDDDDDDDEFHKLYQSGIEVAETILSKMRGRYEQEHHHHYQHQHRHQKNV